MENNKEILLIGAGGHCKVVIDSIKEKNEFNGISLIDPSMQIGEAISGITVIGKDEDLQCLFNQGYKYAFITVGSVGNTDIRKRLFKFLKKIGFSLPTIVDRSAKISPYTNIMEGAYIGRNAVVNSHTTIGSCAIINTGAIIEHDNVIGDFVHISPGAVLSGNVKIGNNTHIGANSTIINNVEIGSDTIVGIGSVVLKDIKSNSIAYGNPCVEVFK